MKMLYWPHSFLVPYPQPPSTLRQGFVTVNQTCGKQVEMAQCYACAVLRLSCVDLQLEELVNIGWEAHH